jgi:hypothetical protein
VQESHLVNESDFQKLFIETMKRHREEALHGARDRHIKFRDKAKFFF